ncbi:hypothetical protein SFC55_24985 [Niallia taxi]|uniref:hypothetical protein n=1 Tax=Niallia taxi TaxID=2499688 RepID=UPI003981957B
MKNFLVIKHETFSDFFHSVIKADSLDEASKKFIVSNDYESTKGYFIFPLVNYSFDENNRISVPENTPRRFVLAVQAGNGEQFKEVCVTNGS